MEPQLVVLWVIGVGKAGELQLEPGEVSNVIASDSLFAGVDDPHHEQLAVIILGQDQQVAIDHRHGYGSPLA
jgi:hypothetical protein